MVREAWQRMHFKWELNMTSALILLGWLCSALLAYGTLRGDLLLLERADKGLENRVVRLESVELVRDKDHDMLMVMQGDVKVIRAMLERRFGTTPSSPP